MWREGLSSNSWLEAQDLSTCRTYLARQTQFELFLPHLHVGAMGVLLPAESTGCQWVMGLDGISIPLNLCFAIAGLRSSMHSRSRHAVHAYLCFSQIFMQISDLLPGTTEFLATLKAWCYFFISSTETVWSCYCTSAQNGWWVGETDGFLKKKEFF